MYVWTTCGPVTTKLDLHQDQTKPESLYLKLILELIRQFAGLRLVFQESWHRPCLTPAQA